MKSSCRYPIISQYDDIIRIRHNPLWRAKAEGERFELSVGFPTHAFQACALDHYANPPMFAFAHYTQSPQISMSDFQSLQRLDPLLYRRVRRE